MELLRVLVCGMVVAAMTAAGGIAAGGQSRPNPPLSPEARERNVREQRERDRAEAQWEYNHLCRQIATAKFESGTSAERSRARSRLLYLLFDVERIVKQFGDAILPQPPFATSRHSEVRQRIEAIKIAIHEDTPHAPRAPKDAKRVAILNFGRPAAPGAQGSDDYVGLAIRPAAWEAAIPLLEADCVGTVIVRVECNGGLLDDIKEFHRVFHEEYKPRFRTVMWVMEAFSTAAMCVWPIEEMVVSPEGVIGGCTGFSTCFVVSPSRMGAEELHAWMLKASVLAQRDPRIMESMQMLIPLSATFAIDGTVTFFADRSDDRVISTAKTPLILNARDAVAFKLARGVATHRDDLLGALGLTGVEWAGAEAAAFLDEIAASAFRAESEFFEQQQKYGRALNAARRMRAEGNQAAVDARIAEARPVLGRMRELISITPGLARMSMLNAEWFGDQETLVKHLQHAR